MKKLILFLTVLVFTSCSKNEIAFPKNPDEKISIEIYGSGVAEIKANGVLILDPRNIPQEGDSVKLEVKNIGQESLIAKIHRGDFLISNFEVEKGKIKTLDLKLK